MFTIVCHFIFLTSVSICARTQEYVKILQELQAGEARKITLHSIRSHSRVGVWGGRSPPQAWGFGVEAPIIKKK
jgi:hypothetical protein